MFFFSEVRQPPSFPPDYFPVLPRSHYSLLLISAIHPTMLRILQACTCCWRYRELVGLRRPENLTFNQLQKLKTIQQRGACYLFWLEFIKLWLLIRNEVWYSFLRSCWDKTILENIMVNFDDRKEEEYLNFDDHFNDGEKWSLSGSGKTGNCFLITIELQPVSECAEGQAEFAGQHRWAGQPWCPFETGGWNDSKILRDNGANVFHLRHDTCRVWHFLHFP